MGNSFQQNGDVITLTAPAGGVTIDTPVLIGSLLVIPQSTEAVGVSFAGQVTGVVEGMAKETGQTWSEGEKVYWDDGNSRFTTDAVDGILAGVAAADATSGATTGSVRLNGSAPAASEGPQAAITDLTENSGAIGGTSDGDLPDLSATTNSITDNTGGTASTSALADLSDGTTYGNDHAAIENNFATLGAEAEATKADVASAVAAIRENSEKINSILAALRAFGVISS